MKVLAIDTATAVASAAVVELGTDSAVALATEDVAADGRRERLLPAIERVLATSGYALEAMDAIAVGAGPGSFTGLRIGLTTAKGLAFAAGKPLWLASSLEALAWDLAETAAIGALLVPVLDARRGEVYVGGYRRCGATLAAVGAEQVLPPDQLGLALAAFAADPVELIGDALAVHASALTYPDGARLRADARATPSAFGVARAAGAGERRDALALGAPAYLRRAEAEVLYPNGVPGAMPRR